MNSRIRSASLPPSYSPYSPVTRARSASITSTKKKSAFEGLDDFDSFLNRESTSESEEDLKAKSLSTTRKENLTSQKTKPPKGEKSLGSSSSVSSYEPTPESSLSEAKSTSPETPRKVSNIATQNSASWAQTIKPAFTLSDDSSEEEKKKLSKIQQENERKEKQRLRKLQEEEEKEKLRSEEELKEKERKERERQEQEEEEERIRQVFAHHLNINRDQGNSRESRKQVYGITNKFSRRA